LERTGEISDETLDAGFGFEAIGLAVTTAERIEPGQSELAVGLDEIADERADERCAELIDGLAQRLGRGSVRRLAPVASHLPERAEALVACDECTASSPWPAADQARPRPLLMFAQAEPAEVLAQVPE